MNLSFVSDSKIKSEYLNRFTLKRGDKIQSSNDAIMQFQSLMVANAEKEEFYCLFLSGNNSVITIEKLFEGSISSSAVYPRQIIKRVLELNALALIIAHNHPSGNLNPSQDDLNITKRIKNALELVDCVLHDHLIIGYGKNDVYSFTDHGLI
jgi:DNA repair protein RadC